MWLKNGDQTVLVSPQGSSILRWQFREHDIFWPAGIVRVGDQLKTRGVGHWCCPNFGTIKEPKYAGTFPQHGFVRQTDLDMANRSMNAVLFNKILPSEDGVVLNLLQVEVTVHQNGVSTRLLITNHCKERMPILAAHHPYLAVPPEGINLMVGGKFIGGKDIPANSHPEEDMKIERRGLPVLANLLGIGRLSLELSENCTHIVIWTDMPSKYVCMEPVFGTPGSYGTEEGNWLSCGETGQYGVGFRFEPF